MILLMILLLLIIIAVMILMMYIMTKLIDFEVDHVNPIDLCSTIEKLVKPFIILDSINVLITLIEIKTCWILFLMNGAILAQTVIMKQKKHRIFEPMTIVRDMSKTKGQIIIVLVVSSISFIIALVQTLFAAFT